MSKDTVVKMPPIGVKPKYVENYHRALELHRAIGEYIQYAYATGKKCNLIDKWILELRDIVAGDNFYLKRKEDAPPELIRCISWTECGNSDCEHYYPHYPYPSPGEIGGQCPDIDNKFVICVSESAEKEVRQL